MANDSLVEQANNRLTDKQTLNGVFTMLSEAKILIE